MKFAIYRNYTCVAIRGTIDETIDCLIKEGVVPDTIYFVPRLIKANNDGTIGADIEQPPYNVITIPDANVNITEDETADKYPIGSAVRIDSDLRTSIPAGTIGIVSNTARFGQIVIKVGRESFCVYEGYDRITKLDSIDSRPVFVLNCMKQDANGHEWFDGISTSLFRNEKDAKAAVVELINRNMGTAFKTVGEIKDYMARQINDDRPVWAFTITETKIM